MGEGEGDLLALGCLGRSGEESVIGGEKIEAFEKPLFGLLRRCQLERGVGIKWW